MSEMEIELYCSLKNAYRGKAPKSINTSDGATIYWLDDFSDMIGIEIGESPLFTPAFFIPGRDWNASGADTIRRYATERGIDKVIALAAGLRILQLREGA